MSVLRETPAALRAFAAEARAFGTSLKLRCLQMKLPRWVVNCLLFFSVCGMLSPAAWWWITWPRRTYREFHGLVERGAFEDAHRILRGQEYGFAKGPLRLSGKDLSVMFTAEGQVVWLSDAGVVIHEVNPDGPPKPRSAIDLILARAKFKTGDGLPELEFTAERGKLWVVPGYRKP